MDEQQSNDGFIAGAFPMYMLGYWPLHFLHYLIRFTVFIIRHLWIFAAIGCVICVCWRNVQYPEIGGIENLLCLRNIIPKSRWVQYLIAQESIIDVEGAPNYLLSSILYLGCVVGVYILWPMAPFVVIWSSITELQNNTNWDDIQKYWDNVFADLHSRAFDIYRKNKRQYFVKMSIALIQSLVVVILVVILICALCYLIPIALQWIHTTTGY